MSGITTCPHCRRDVPRDGVQRAPHVCPHCHASFGNPLDDVSVERPRRNLDVERPTDPIVWVAIALVAAIFLFPVFVALACSLFWRQPVGFR